MARLSQAARNEGPKNSALRRVKACYGGGKNRGLTSSGLHLRERGTNRDSVSRNATQEVPDLLEKSGVGGRKKKTLGGNE